MSYKLSYIPALLGPGLSTIFVWWGVSQTNLLKKAMAPKRMTMGQLAQALKNTMVSNTPPSATQKRRRRRRRARNITGSSQMIQAPTASGAIFKIARPLVGGRRASLPIEHVEQVLIVAQGQSTFVADIINLVPVSFSWLTPMAVQFSEYRWLSLTVIYMPEVGTNTAGAVSMGFKFDITDTAPNDPASLANLEGFVTAPVWAGYDGAGLLNTEVPLPTKFPPGAVATCLDVKRLTKPWYQFKSNPPITDEGNIYSPAQLCVGVSGNGATSTTGRLYVRYRIELVHPMSASDNEVRILGQTKRDNEDVPPPQRDPSLKVTPSKDVKCI
uniref:Capsid protein n=1 Tax=Physalis rugose mosaic virus TaxID=2607629 RepID=A0A7H0XHX8_9VIRU|nr:ORF3 [Physalis rugose mosaic virus]